MYFGIEIGGSKLQIVAGDGAGAIARRWRYAVPPGTHASVIRAKILQGLGEMGDAVEPRAVGVGFGGPVDRASGRVARSHQVQGWEEFDLGGWLSSQLHLPVAVENDSTLAAWAEATCGAAAGDDPVFYFNLGSGVGGGIVVDRRIYHGVAPGEAEFGHVRLDRTATVESRCSGWAIDRKIRELAATHPESFLVRAIGQSRGGEAKHLAAAIAHGDLLAAQIIRELADDVALALSHVIHLLHPAVIVMGGGLALVGERLRGAIEAALPAYVMHAFHPPPPLRLARLGEDAVPIGALLLAAASD